MVSNSHGYFHTVNYDWIVQTTLEVSSAQECLGRFQKSFWGWVLDNLAWDCLISMWLLSWPWLSWRLSDLALDLLDLCKMLGLSLILDFLFCPLLNIRWHLCNWHLVLRITGARELSQAMSDTSTLDMLILWTSKEHRRSQRTGCFAALCVSFLQTNC